MEAELLQARDLVVAAGAARLIDIPALTLRAGAPTLILGPNGAGKSLLLRLLHGLVAPTAGSVRTAPVRQAMLFQRPVILRRSVAANIAFALPTGAPAGRLADLLALAGLAGRARQPARTLSAGEQQRLALVRALATDPGLLFLDEPTSSLDPMATLAIETLVQQTAAAGTKVVMVTHDVGQARRLAGEVLFLHRGRLLEQTPAESFFREPATEPARIFLAGGLAT